MIIECPECKGQVSTQATSCPHCGAPVKQQDSPEPTGVPIAWPHAPKPKRSTSARRVLVLLGVGVVAASLLWYFAPPSGREQATNVVGSALRLEQTLFAETFEVPAGGYRGWDARLGAEARVTVAVDVRDGSAVNVYLMTPAQKREFDEVRRNLFGGQFTYTGALSSISTRRYSNSVVLPAGTWHFVIASTETTPLLGKGRTATVHAKLTTQR